MVSQKMQYVTEGGKAFDTFAEADKAERIELVRKALHLQVPGTGIVDRLHMVDFIITYQDELTTLFQFINGNIPELPKRIFK